MIEGRLFAIVPVKPLREGKSRLSSIMDQQEREQFNTFLMRRTFDVIAAFPGHSSSVVVSADEKVAAEAEARGINFVKDEERDLNGALARATRAAMQQGADAVIVLPVDLPLATSADLESIVPLSGLSKVCVIVPDRHRSGTNLLYIAPPCEDLYCFGHGSFDRHREAAARRGFRVIESDKSNLMLDIDEPVDYERWCSSPSGNSQHSAIVREPRSGDR